MFYVAAFFVAITLNFFIPRWMPGDPATRILLAMRGKINADQIDAIRAVYGFKGNLWEQYTGYLWRLVHFDFGISTVNFPAPTADLLAPLVVDRVGDAVEVERRQLGRADHGADRDLLRCAREEVPPARPADAPHDVGPAEPEEDLLHVVGREPLARGDVAAGHRPFGGSLGEVQGADEAVLRPRGDAHGWRIGWNMGMNKGRPWPPLVRRVPAPSRGLSRP